MIPRGIKPDRPPRPWPDAPQPDLDLAGHLNANWRVTPPDAGQPSYTTGLAGRLRAWLSRLLRWQQVIDKQEAFNAAVVRFINHSNSLYEVRNAREASLRAMADDTFGNVDAAFDQLDAIAHEVDARLSPAEDELRRHSEALRARERRIGDAIEAMRAEHAELRTAIGVLQHQAHQLAKIPAAASAAPAAATSGAAGPPSAPDALSYRYVGFEDAFRGSQEAIRAGLAAYVPLFEGASDVLDIGCGRGEFLALLGERGISARGIDLNEAMVEVCRGRGLDASVADALGYLQKQPDRSLGGIFAAQVVEHLQPAYLTHLLDAAFEKLRPGGLIVLETINPACWFAFFESYIRDITHERALHPDTLKFLLIAAGFQKIDIRYSSPYPAHEKLQPVAAAALGEDAAETLNANTEKINRLLFTYLDYAAIARRP